MAKTQSKSKRPKAHHVLPQFYLRAWADDDGLVAMLNREGQEVKTGTRALAVENDFYTATAPDGTKDSVVEEALADRDGKGAAVHAAFLRGEFPPSEEQRIEFGLWLGLQWLRGRASRQTGREFYDKFHKMLIQLGLEEREPAEGSSDPEPDDPEAQEIIDGLGPGVPVPDLTGLSDELKEILRNPDLYSFEPSREQQLLQMLQGVPRAAEPFLESTWQLVRFDRPVLLTSDEPILLSRIPAPQNRFLGLGPANADFLAIPLAPTHCLLMARTTPMQQEMVLDCPVSEADDFNDAMIEAWWQQLFRLPQGPPFPRKIPPLPDERIVVG